MTLNEVLPFISSAIMLVFVVSVLARWLRRRSPYLLVWAVGLSMFALGTLAEAYSAVAWNSLVFRSWYLFGAMLTAAWIGQGTVYLLARRTVSHVTLAVLVVLSLVGLYGMLSMPLNVAAFSSDLPLSDQYREILPSGAWVRFPMTPFLNIYGTVAIVGGALYSSWLFWRKRVLPNRMWGSILIAVGALSTATAGTLSRLGYGEFLYLSELVAAVFMFAGFILATQPAAQAASRTVFSGAETE